MKQRTRAMLSSDELISFSMAGAKKHDDETEIQLHRVRPQEHFIEAQVVEGDTLQAIALRFHCSIAELKRINQIHKDNEIYARRTIKVPVTPFSVLTELIPAPPESLPSTSSHSPRQLSSITASEKNGKIDKSSDQFSIDCNAAVMNSTLAPAVTPYTDAEPNEHLITEDTQLLPGKAKVPVETVVVKQLTSQGADWGIKWYHLVCLLLFLGVVIPLVYVMFYLDKHEHSDMPPIPPLHSMR